MSSGEGCQVSSPSLTLLWNVNKAIVHREEKTKLLSSSARRVLFLLSAQYLGAVWGLDYNSDLLFCFRFGWTSMKCQVCLWDFSIRDGKHLIPDIAFWGLFRPWGFYTLNPNPSPSLSSNPGYTLCGQIRSPFFFLLETQQLFCFAAEWSNVLLAMVSGFADFGGSAVTEFPPSAPARVPRPATQHSGLSAGLEQLFPGAMLIRHWSSWSKMQNQKPNQNTYTKKKKAKSFLFHRVFCSQS